MLVEVSNAQFGYDGRPVVEVERLVVHAGRALGVFGPNGAGKTTLIRGVTGLLAPLRGTVIVSPVPSVARHSDAETNCELIPSRTSLSPLEYQTTRAPAALAGGPLRFAYMPQQRAMELHWPMSGFDAAALATSARRRFGWLDGGARDDILAMMRNLSVDDLADRSFSRLSGGQQQRILLAGAMASRPDVLVLDEPTDGLDVASTRELLRLLRQFTADGLAVVIISHEIEDLLQLCDDVAWLHPAETVGGPSHVEMISPQALAERMVHLRGGR